MPESILSIIRFKGGIPANYQQALVVDFSCSESREEGIFIPLHCVEGAEPVHDLTITMLESRSKGWLETPVSLPEKAMLLSVFKFHEAISVRNCASYHQISDKVCE